MVTSLAEERRYQPLLVLIASTETCTTATPSSTVSSATGTSSSTLSATPISTDIASTSTFGTSSSTTEICIISSVLKMMSLQGFLRIPVMSYGKSWDNQLCLLFNYLIHGFDLEERYVNRFLIRVFLEYYSIIRRSYKVQYAPPLASFHFLGIQLHVIHTQLCYYKDCFRNLWRVSQIS
jgi:hypothetical protein